MPGNMGAACAWHGLRGRGCICPNRATGRVPRRDVAPKELQPQHRGLFGWSPGKFACTRQQSQASDFGRLGLGSLPARLIQTAPELPNTMASAGAGCFKMSLIIVLNIASNALISALDCLFIWMIPHRSFTAAACWVVAPAPIIGLEPFPGCSWSNPDEIPRAPPCGLLCGQTKRLFSFPFAAARESRRQGSKHCLGFFLSLASPLSVPPSARSTSPW